MKQEVTANVTGIITSYAEYYTVIKGKRTNYKFTSVNLVPKTKDTLAKEKRFIYIPGGEFIYYIII